MCYNIYNKVKIENNYIMPSITEARFHYKISGNQFEYEKYFEAYTKALTSVWNYKEVSMTEDVLNWEMATGEEKEILSGILRAFTQIETVIGDYWTTFVSKIFPKPEIISMCTAYGFFETIHAAAYNHLSATLGIDEYEAYVGDPLAQQKVEYLLNEIASPKVKLAIFSGAAEGVALFSAFSILLSFCKEGKFKGLSQIISWSILDEDCVTGDTQILTKDGWKNIKDYDEANMEEIAQFNPETKEITFVKPLKYIKSTTNKLYRIYKNNRYSQLLTPNHTIVDYHEATKAIRKNTAENWNKRSSYIPVSGHLCTRGITPLDRFLIALQADGSIRGGRSKREVGFGFKRLRKINRFRELAKELTELYGFDIKEYPPNNREKVKFRVLIPDSLLSLRTKFFDEYYTYNNIPEGFIEEIQYWDGSSSEESTSIYYSSKEYRNIIFVQTAASLNGYYGHIITQEDYRWSKPCLQYRLYLKKVESVPARDGIKEEIFLDSPTNTYCFKVPTQAFLIKLDGLISITGNCHSKMGSELFKDLVKEQGITQEEIDSIIEGFQAVLQNEIAFLNNVFGDLTKINNLEKDAFIHFLYSKYNQRLEQLGLSPKYYIEYNSSLAFQISSWFDSLSTGNISQDFFAYAKDGSQYVAKPDFDISKVDWNNLSLT